MGTVFDVSSTSWDKDVLQNDHLVLVEFWHRNCPWCKSFDPIYHTIAKKYKGAIIFAKLNALASNENKDIARRYGVMGTPTLMFFCRGKPIATAVGFKPKEEFERFINTIFSNTKSSDCLDKTTEFKTI
jgi:thioredoxin 1